MNSVDATLFNSAAFAVPHRRRDITAPIAPKTVTIELAKIGSQSKSLSLFVSLGSYPW